MAPGRHVRGSVKPLPGDTGGGAARVVVTRGGSVVAAARVARNGSFQTAIPDAPDLVVTVFGRDNRVLRRRLKAGRAARLDLGSLKLPASEFPPGIFGQAWDAAAECPLTGGRATLRRDKAIVATVPLDGNGGFAIELTEQMLLPAGTYHLSVDVPGYAPAACTIIVTDEVTSYRIGRVELAAARAA